jgi:hypothetical protein
LVITNAIGCHSSSRLEFSSLFFRSNAVIGNDDNGPNDGDGVAVVVPVPVPVPVDGGRVIDVGVELADDAAEDDDVESTSLELFDFFCINHSTIILS